MKMQINIVYCNNDRVNMPCVGMSQQEVYAKLEAFRAMPEVFEAWLTIGRRR